MYKLNLNGHASFLTTLADVLVALNSRVQKAEVSVFSPTGEPMHVVLNNFGKFGVQRPGSVEDLFIHMLNEVTFAYIKPLGRVLQPYEMMPAAWHAFIAIGSAVYNVYPCFDSEQRRQWCSFLDKEKNTRIGGIEYFMMLNMIERFGYGHNGPLYGPTRDSNGRHEVHVAYALADGLDVPENVIEWYRAHPQEVESVGGWFATLLNFPEYRGKIPANKLCDLESLLRLERPPIKLTSENADYFIELLANLPDDISRPKLDDFLYQAKALKSLPVPAAPAEPDLSFAYSPFAVTLREMLGLDLKKADVQRAHKNHDEHHHGLRALEYSLAMAERRLAEVPLCWANKVAKAMAERDVSLLLELFDTPDDCNKTSKRAIQDAFGLKVLRVKAADRRSAIFAYCGFDDLKRSQFEKGVERNVVAKLVREIEQVNTPVAKSKPLGRKETVHGYVEADSIYF